MLDVRQNTFQGQNFFPHTGNQFWGQFNGVFAGDGTRITNVIASGFPNPLPAGTFAGANSSGTQLGTSAKPVIFYGVFHGVGAGAFIGDGTSLTGIPQLGATQTWTGDNTWTGTGNNFTPGPLTMGNSSATVPAFIGYGFAGVTGQFSAFDTLYTCSSGYAGGIPVSGLFSETTCQLGYASTPNTDLSLYCYGYIYSAGNINAALDVNCDGQFNGSPAGLTDFKSGTVTGIAIGTTSVTVSFNTAATSSSYSITIALNGGAGSGSGGYFVASRGTAGFVVSFPGGTTLAIGALDWQVFPANNP